MTSQVLSNPSLLDANYPARGINNDSQGFRDNFSTIKTALLTTNTEIDNLHRKTITITGDASGVSSVFGSGTSTSNLNLTLATQNNIVPGDYNTETHNLVLTVNNKGLLTDIVATPVQVVQYTGVAGTWTPTISPYVAGSPPSGTGDITLPRFTVNSQGNITNVSTVTLPNFGVLGHTLTKGYLVVGSQYNKTQALAVGSDGQVLIADATQPNGLRWGTAGGSSYTPPTYAGVAGTWAPSMDGYPGTGDITFPTFTVNSNGEITSVSNTVMSQFGLRKLTLLKGNLVVGDSNDESDFLPPGSDGQVLMVDSVHPSGIKWGTVTTQNVTDGQAITITGTSVNLSLQTLTQSSTTQPQDLFVFRDQNNSVHKKITASDLRTQILTNLDIINDTSPQLGGNLDVLDKVITTSNNTAGVQIQHSKLLLNGQLWPGGIGTDNYYLGTDGSGNLSWREIKITASSDGGLAVAPVGGITGTGSISINVNNMIDKTNEYVSGDMIPIYRGSMTTHYKVNLNDFMINFGTSLVVVDATRTRSYEANGSVVHPYATIPEAISAVATNGTILVMPGNYADNLIISKTLRMVGWGHRNSVNILGNITILSGLNGKLLFDNLTFNYTSRDASQTTAPITFQSDVYEVTFTNCNLYRGSSALSLLPIINFSGSQNNHVWVTNCFIQGKIINSMTTSTSNLYLQDIYGTFNNALSLEITNGRTIVSNTNMITYCDHSGGYVEFNNIDNFVGHAFGTNDLIAIDSTASGANDYITLRNCNFMYINDIYQINKTGSCQYNIVNCVYDDTSDFSGQRSLFRAFEVDSFKQVYSQNITTANITLNPNKSNTFVLNLNTSTTVTLSTPISWVESAEYKGGVEITVIVTQDASGGRTCVFSGVLWDQGSQPALQTGANKTTIYKFTRISNSGTWLGWRVFYQG